MVSGLQTGPKDLGLEESVSLEEEQCKDILVSDTHSTLLVFGAGDPLF